MNRKAVALAALIAMPVIMGISVKMEDAPRYAVAAGSSETVFRVDTASGEICRFTNGKLTSCFGIEEDDDNP
jgi:hypothetical protein